MSQDKNLMSAFREGADIHKLTASRIFGCPAEMVTPEMRDQAKVINFGIIYGMTAHRLARDFKILQKAAQAFIDDYFAAHPGVKRWIDQTLRFATDTGYVLTMLKRRRYVPNITSRNKSLHMEAQRIAINTPIQGTSADMIKQAMIRIHHDLQQSNFRTRMIMQVHDELIFDAPHDEIDRVSALIKQHMENALTFDVPIRVDVKWGNNWAEC
jgi:DNA polymerase-1